MEDVDTDAIEKVDNVDTLSNVDGRHNKRKKHQHKEGEGDNLKAAQNEGPSTSGLPDQDQNEASQRSTPSLTLQSSIVMVAGHLTAALGSTASHLRVRHRKQSYDFDISCVSLGLWQIGTRLQAT